MQVETAVWRWSVPSGYNHQHGIVTSGEAMQVFTLVCHLMEILYKISTEGRLSRFLIGSDLSDGKVEDSEQEMEPGEHTMHNADVP